MAPSTIVRLMAGRTVRQPNFPASVRLQRLHQSSLLRFPRKDSQDKDSINTDATEYAKSGTDDDVARNEKAAFDPSQTNPGEEKETAGQGNEVQLTDYDCVKLKLMLPVADQSSRSITSQSRSFKAGRPTRGRRIEFIRGGISF